MAESDRWLALETSGVYGSLAAGVGERMLRYAPLPTSDRTIRTLAPSIEALLAEVGWKPAELGFFSVGVGPGSFTGLRIGVMTAKTMAYALRKPIVGVDTLAATASEFLGKREGMRGGAPEREEGSAVRRRYRVSGSLRPHAWAGAKAGRLGAFRGGLSADAEGNATYAASERGSSSFRREVLRDALRGRRRECHRRPERGGSPSNHPFQGVRGELR